MNSLIPYLFITLFLILPSNTITTRYAGSFYNANYVWAAAMNLAWNQLKDSIIK